MNYKEKLEKSKYLQDEIEERIGKIVGFISDNFYENDEDLYHPLETLWNYEVVSLDTTYDGLNLKVIFKDIHDPYSEDSTVYYNTVEIPYSFLDATTDEELLELVKIDAKVKYKNELEQSKREIICSIQRKEAQLENVEKHLKGIEE